MTAPTHVSTPMGGAVRKAIADHNAQPAVDRRHLELLRAAATRLDTAEAEEMALRSQYVTAMALLNAAMRLLNRGAFVGASREEADILKQQVIHFTSRIPAQ